MTSVATKYSYSLISTSFAEDYVLHVGNSSLVLCLILEINRPQTMNAYNNEYPRVFQTDGSLCLD